MEGIYILVHCLCLHIVLFLLLCFIYIRCAGRDATVYSVMALDEGKSFTVGWHDTVVGHVLYPILF